MSENENNSEKKKNLHNGIEVNLEVSGKEEIEKLQTALEAERTEKEDLASKLEIIAEKAFEEKKKSVKCEDPDINDPSKLEAWLKGKEEKHKNPATPTGGGGSGKAPLSSEPSTQEDLGIKEYATHEEMYADIAERAKSPIKEVREEALEVQKKLFEKFGNNPKIVTPFEKEINLGKLIEQNIKIQNENLKKVVNKEHKEGE